MALTVTDQTNDITLAVNREYMPTFLMRALPCCPYLTGSKKGEIAKQGSTATALWRRIENVTPSTTALSEVTTAAYMQGRTPSQLSKTDVTATVQKYGDFIIMNEEVTEFEKNPIIDDTVANLGEAAGRSVNMLQRNVLEDNLTARYAAGAASAGATISTITVGDIRKVLNDLRVNNAKSFSPMTTGSENIGTAPQLPAFWGLGHPDLMDDIAQLTGFVSVEKYAGQIDVVPGEVGSLATAGARIRFVESSDASVDSGTGATVTSQDVNATSGSADLYTLCVIGQEAHASVGFGEQHTDGIYRAGEGGLDAVSLIVKNEGGTSDPYDEISTIAYKFWHAGAVLNGAFGRSIIAATTNLDN
jgi:N4-gp56 family major capsid protein